MKIALEMSAHMPKQILVQWMEQAVQKFKQGDQEAFREICAVGSLCIQKDLIEREGIEAVRDDIDRTLKGRELLNPDRWKS